MLLFTRYPIHFTWIIEVPTEIQTFLCYIKWKISHFLEAELKHVLPGWSQPPGLGFSPFNVRLLRQHPKEEGSPLSSPAYQALLQRDARLKGTQLPQGHFLQITQGAAGKQVHTRLDACKLDGMDFETNGSMSTVLPGCFRWSCELGQPWELMNCWDELIIPGEGNWRLQGNPLILNHEKMFLETVGLFTTKMNQCISCFKTAFYKRYFRSCKASLSLGYLHPARNSCWAASASEGKLVLEQQRFKSFLDALK